jgi:hypothetical protein
MKIEEILKAINESIDSEVKAIQATHSIGYGAAGYGSIGIDSLKKLIEARSKIILAECEELTKN